MLSPAAFEALTTQPVTFIHSERQKKSRVGAVRAQHLREQSQRSDPVDIVVAKKYDALSAIDSLENPVDRRGHLRQKKRIT